MYFFFFLSTDYVLYIGLSFQFCEEIKIIIILDLFYSEIKVLGQMPSHLC